MPFRSARRFLFLSLAASVLLVAAACDLDPSNENNPTEAQTLTTPEGLRTLTVGLQELYATSALSASTVNATSITAREVAINTTFANLIEIERGGTALPSNNANVESIWSTNYRVVGIAEDLIENAPQVNLSAGTQSGIVATAQLFKAMALGNIALAFEQAPTDTRRDGATSFVPRSEVLRAALLLLEDALSTLDATPPSEAFTGSVLQLTTEGGPPVEGLRNIIQAYRARFFLLNGDFASALTAADQVDPAITSTFPYNDQSPNPFWGEFVQSGDLAPRDNFGSPLTEEGDARLAFFTSPSDAVSTPNELPIEEPAGFYTSSSRPVPVFVPGEMPLIRAEALLEQGAGAEAVVAAINAVRTKTPDEDPFGIGAALAPYDGAQTPDALREEILRQRRAELYLQGLALADQRRLGPEEVSDRQAPGPFERSRNAYPYPDQEQRNNPNTPESPDF